MTDRRAKWREGVRVLALDPSSTACGWAVLDAWPIDVVGFNVVRPGGRKCAVDRMRRITSEITALADQYDPDVVLLEWADGKQHGRIAGRSQGLSTLGQAQGWLACRLEWLDHDVQYVTPKQWTGSRAKDKRAKNVIQKYPEYAEWAVKGRDRHLDAADALGLADWWLAKHRLDDVLRGEVA